MNCERMMKFRPVWRRAIWLMLLPLSLLTGCQLAASPIYQRMPPAPGVKTTKVLFIGDSLTYYNDLPGLLAQLSAKEERPLEVDDVTVAYASLGAMWNHSAARGHLNRGGWDYVVLQEFSVLPVMDPQTTRDNFRRFGDAATRVGAQPIIFENWTRRHRDQNADFNALRETYRQVQRETGGQIAPIGTAWKLCTEQHPEIALYADDRHPTVAGTYLAACILYRTIYHKPATGLATSLGGLKLAPAVATTLQQVADAAWRQAER